jgi:hypothetical protein
MGLFDGITAGLIRRGPDGARFYAPLGKWGQVYAVPDDEAAARIRSEWRALSIALFAFSLGVVFLAGASWKVIVAAPAVLLVTIPFSHWVARQLPKADLKAADLVPVSRAELIREQGQAIGRRTLAILSLLSLGMTVVAVVAALVVNGGFGQWWPAGFFALCTAVIYAQYRVTQ